MIPIRSSKRDDLEIFHEMDRKDHARNFVNQTGIETDQKYSSDPKITYLSIENSLTEFRRILIDQKKHGIGQAAICEMESYCKNKFNVKRI